MNRRQKLVQQQFLNNEETVIKRLQYIYDKSLTEIDDKIRNLEFSIGDLTEEYDWADDAEKDVISSKIQAKIYQKQYQEQLRKQVEGILNEMQTKQFTTIAEYLDTCYEDGFIGTVFDMHGQGVPLMMPIDQEAMVRAVQLESKLTTKKIYDDGTGKMVSLYEKLGEDVGVLKKRIASEVTRSIATGSSYQQVAQRLAGQTRIGYNKAVRIARTEGHRIQTTAAMDAMEKAKNMGADVVKQWDATLDDRTRESHMIVDGEIREVDEAFSNGLMFPGDPDGGAAEVINCRCALLQRARWALDEKMNPDTGEVIWEDGSFSKFDRESGKIVDFKDSDDYNTFKKKYLKVMNQPESITTLTLADCEDVAAVERLFKNQRWFNVETINGATYDTNEDSTLNGMDLDCAKSIYTTHEKLFTKYPQLVGKLNGLSTASLSPTVYAQCHVGFGHGGITVNLRHYRDVARLARSYNRGVDGGFHPAGTTFHSIVMHELGHAIDDYLTNTLQLAGKRNYWEAKWVSADMRPRVMRACGLKVADARTEVSGYATKDHFEWFAECFCEYMDSDNPRPVAAEFGRQFEELMKQVT